MKRLVALMMCAVSLGAAAQFPNLPYNPDENGDGLIGVADLQGLLTLYSQEFSGAVVSENLQDAILFLGNMSYPTCHLQCKSLPGGWHMADETEIGLVFDEIVDADIYTRIWLGEAKFSAPPVNLPTDIDEATFYTSAKRWDSNITDSGSLAVTSSIEVNSRCYCAVSERPKLEWTFCEHYGNGSNDQLPSAIQDCVNEKLLEGWYPLGPPSTGNYSISQSFWRWAE